MSAPTHDETVTGAGRPHPTDRDYVIIAVILAVITALEVVSFYIEETLGDLMIPALVVMMVAKFAIVAAFFMHLRFDSNLFTRVFVSGLALAVGVYVAALLTFRLFA